MARCWVLAWALVCGGAAPFAAAAVPAFEIGRLDPAGGDASAEVVARGALDSRFGDYSLREVRTHGGPFWLRLTVPDDAATPAGRTSGAPALLLEKGRHLQPELYFDHAPLPLATSLPGPPSAASTTTSLLLSIR